MAKRRKRSGGKALVTGLYGGVDPGREGFLALYDGEDVYDSQPIPWLDRTPDLQALLRIFRHWKDTGVRFVVLEHQQAFPRDSAKSAFSLGRGYCALEMGMAATGIPHETIKPSDWKRRMSIPIPAKSEGRAEKLKALAISKAQCLFPGFDFRKSTRCKKAHSGKAEAVLMAVLAFKISRGG